ncbi:hypothetical protein [Hydrogenophaga sp. BPS33]|uniref:hypothetical protein n=1 Tax=Hydrogenophaga sp. BPS33 TaxID=2651974 RepID=UPI00131FBA59|nr:hypothetical protein [Hydrogenophaga sp. BPS33]QHE85180.1 hypothetical protein F9K07_09915 [Hydrogenophaga sp. BPS33]
MSSVRDVQTRLSKPSQPVGDDHDNKRESSRKTEKHPSGQGDVVKRLVARAVQMAKSEPTRNKKTGLDKDREAHQKTNGHLEEAIKAMPKSPKDVYREMREIATTLKAVAKRHPSKTNNAEAQLLKAFKDVHLAEALPKLGKAELTALKQGLSDLTAPGSKVVDLLLSEFATSVDAALSALETATLANPSTVVAKAPQKAEAPEVPATQLLLDVRDQDDRSKAMQPSTAKGIADVPMADVEKQPNVMNKSLLAARKVPQKLLRVPQPPQVKQASTLPESLEKVGQQGAKGASTGRGIGDISQADVVKQPPKQMRPQPVPQSTRRLAQVGDTRASTLKALMQTERASVSSLDLKDPKASDDGVI